jgi:hypothetical protein
MVANSAIQMVTTEAGPSWAVLVVYAILPCPQSNFCLKRWHLMHRVISKEPYS